MASELVKYQSRNLQRRQDDEQHRKNKTTRIVIFSAVGAGAVVGLYFLGRWAYKKIKSQGADKDLPPATTPPAGTTKNTTTPAKTTPDTKPATKPVAAGFPLQKGSKGVLVLQLQRALIYKYGASVLPKYHDDGDFGSETESTLTNNGIAVPVSQTSYNQLVQGYLQKIGNSVLDYYYKNEFDKVIEQLKLLLIPTDYSVASAEFKKNNASGSTASLLESLLDKFTDASQKTALNNQFTRMGLQKNGSTWSVPTNFTLSGPQEYNIVTLRPTQIWIDGEGVVSVEESVMLGKAIGETRGYIRIENNGKEFLALPTDVLLV